MPSKKAADVTTVTRITYKISDSIQLEICDATPRSIKVSIQTGSLDGWTYVYTGAESADELLDALETAIAQLKVWEQR